MKNKHHEALYTMYLQLLLLECVFLQTGQRYTPFFGASLILSHIANNLRSSGGKRIFVESKLVGVPLNEKIMSGAPILKH